MKLHYPINKKFMIKVDLTYIYELSNTLSSILYINEPNIENLRLVKIHIEALLGNSIYTYHLLACKKNAESYLEYISFLLNRSQEKNDKNLSQEDISKLRLLAYLFEVALKSAFTTSPVYMITPKGGFDVDILTDMPALLFPENLLTLVPKAKHDVEQAAKCLAFEIPTAAAFHLHRINETVLHCYWDAISQGEKRPDFSSVGKYICEMETKNLGDKKILEILKQINSLHRNPVLHPQESLTLQEAIILFGIIVSIINSMIPVISVYQTEKAVPLSASSLEEQPA